jgi:hypothetical protein
MRLGLAVALVAAELCVSGCGDDHGDGGPAMTDAAPEDAGGRSKLDSGSAGRPSPRAGAGGADASAADAGPAGAGGDPGQAGDAGAAGSAADSGIDAGPVRPQALPTGIVSSSAASYSTSTSFQLELSAGAPQPYGDSRSNHFVLRLGVHRPQ